MSKQWENNERSPIEGVYMCVGVRNWRWSYFTVALGGTELNL